MKTETEVLTIRGFLKTSRMMAFAQYFKAHGFRATLKYYGWKIFAFIFMAYLVRDVVLYIIIPWWVAQKFLSS